jgi:hypothetical protein
MFSAMQFYLENTCTCGSLGCYSKVRCYSVLHTHISWRWICSCIFWPRSSFTCCGAGAGLEWESWRFSAYIQRFYATLWPTVNSWAPCCTLAQRMFVVYWTILYQILLFFVSSWRVTLNSYEMKYLKRNYEWNVYTICVVVFGVACCTFTWFI